MWIGKQSGITSTGLGRRQRVTLETTSGGTNHRQRFVMLAQNLERRAYYYLSEVGGVVSRVKSLFLNSRLYDVGFSRILQCEKDSCRGQWAYFPTKP